MVLRRTLIRLKIRFPALWFDPSESNKGNDWGPTHRRVEKRCSMLRGFGNYNLIGLFLAVILLGVVSMSNADEKRLVKQPPTVAEAEAFMKNAEAKMLELSVSAARADWVKATYITDDTEILAAQADERAIAAQVEFAKQATRFDGLKLPPELARKMHLLKTSLVLPTPGDPRKSAELTEIASRLE